MSFLHQTTAGLRNLATQKSYLACT